MVILVHNKYNVKMHGRRDLARRQIVLPLAGSPERTVFLDEFPCEILKVVFAFRFYRVVKKII